MQASAVRDEHKSFVRRADNPIKRDSKARGFKNCAVPQNRVEQDRPGCHCGIPRLVHFPPRHVLPSFQQGPVNSQPQTGSPVFTNR